MIRVFLLFLLVVVAGCTRFPDDFTTCKPGEEGSQEAFCYNRRYRSWMKVHCSILTRILQSEGNCPNLEWSLRYE